MAGSIADRIGDVGPGWDGILRVTHERLMQVHPGYSVFQLKEKFGGLRLYLDPIPAELDVEVQQILREAEDLSYKTCEFCGQSGEPSSPPNRPSGWIKTTCETCRSMRL